MEVETVHLIIEGRVQGVFFRASAKEQADKLGINGWVRNLPGGSVEIRAEGKKENLKQFLDWCNTGPPNSEVSNIEIEYLKPTGEFDTFYIKY